MDTPCLFDKSTRNFNVSNLAFSFYLNWGRMRPHIGTVIFFFYDKVRLSLKIRFFKASSSIPPSLFKSKSKTPFFAWGLQLVQFPVTPDPAPLTLSLLAEPLELNALNIFCFSLFCSNVKTVENTEY